MPYRMTLRLALDHLTIEDAHPAALVEAAHATGCAGIGLFLEAMDVLPHMPAFDLCTDRAGRRDLRKQMDECGVALDLVYPFTLSGRTDVARFTTAFECAAELGAARVNLLVYDRDDVRRTENFLAFCALAQGFDLCVAIEFYPASQVRTLDDALRLTARAGQPGTVGVNVDLLHLMRSGGTLADLEAAPPGSILYAQLADGPAQCAAASLDQEASSERALAGDGVFDIAGFARALPNACPLSVEIPRSALLQAGVPRLERARQAVESVRRALDPD